MIRNIFKRFTNHTFRCPRPGQWYTPPAGHVLRVSLVDRECQKVLADFCCCSKQAIFRETLALERAGYLHIRKIATLTIDAKARLQPARGYTILMLRKEVV